MSARRRAPFLLPLLALVAGCGSSGGGGNSETITLSGQVVYECVPPTVSSGLDYAATSEQPVRGATIQAIDGNERVVGTAVLDAGGRFTLSAPRGEEFTLAVLAQLGDPDAPEVVIRDNTNGGARYRAEVAVGARGADTSADVILESGWNGSDYAGARSAAPFAILDTVYAARQDVLAARPGFDFVTQDVFWSPDNAPSGSINYAVGLIGTSHYNTGNGAIYLLGAEDIDTEEYDAAVVAHEWIHYFEHRHARTDSVGGAHGLSSILDETIAFGEGFATTMGALITGDHRYLDTAGTDQGSTIIAIDLESDSRSDTATTSDGRTLDGFWSELSIMEIIWDIGDGGAGDDDAVALGVPVLLDTVLGGQATTPYFTSLYTYLHHLKDQPSVDATLANAIDAIALAENVYPGNEYDPTAAATPTGHRRYNTLADDGMLRTTDPDGNNLASSTVYGAGGNRLLNRVFFRGTASTGGTHTIKLSPSDTSRVARVWRPGRGVVTALRDSDDFEWRIDLAAGELLVFGIEWRAGGSSAAEDFDIAWYQPGLVVPKPTNQ